MAAILAAPLAGVCSGWPDPARRLLRIRLGLACGGRSRQAGVTRSGDSGHCGIGGTAMEIANPVGTALKGFALFWMTGLLGLAFAIGTAQPTHAEGARPVPDVVAPVSVDPAR